MRDRWRNRAETEPGQGTIYWHILLQDKPNALALAREAQERLSSVPGLHMTPRERLHITTLLVGSADSSSSEQTARMLEETRRTLAGVQPVGITLGHILYHPEAIMLGVHPQRALDPILNGVRAGMRHALGEEGTINGAFPSWTPHITVAYSTTDQAAAPIIDILGRELPTCTVLIDAVSLVVQWGPERLWDWQTIGTIRLTPRTSYPKT
ncbi:2'-5' RNA ligase family protein [Actinoallomurus oryzae]|uniref:2'-5' RNA ligase family protein n=1 Tax=Actinoallomurus oryzae TaxID=502180 RepID=UPI003CD0564D